MNEIVNGLHLLYVNVICMSSGYNMARFYDFKNRREHNAIAFGNAINPDENLKYYFPK